MWIKVWEWEYVRDTKYEFSKIGASQLSDTI